MSRSTLPWVVRIEELIADGPVEINWLIGEVYGLVPPGRAWRKREWLRKYTADRSGLNYVLREPTDEAIRTGQRGEIREAIGKLVYAGKAHYLEQDGIKYLERANVQRASSAARARQRREEERHERWVTPNESSDSTSEHLSEAQRRTTILSKWADRTPPKPSS